MKSVDVISTSNAAPAGSYPRGRECRVTTLDASKGDRDDVLPAHIQRLRLIMPLLPRTNRNRPLHSALFPVVVCAASFVVIGTEIVSARENGMDRVAADTTSPSPPVTTQPQSPTLVVGRTDPRRSGDTVPLEISASTLTGAGFAVFSGFAGGTTLNVGNKLGENNWWVPSADLEHVIVQPPPRFVGSMEITVELRLADTRLSDKKTLHLEWLPVPTLDPGEIAGLVKRGNDLIVSGDLAAAQLVLRRAAESGSAEAAITLAGTYDPVLIAKIGAHGFAADVELARQWYEKAKQLGSIEAAHRLQLMAIKRD
jgi:hypothetical protein